MARGGRSLLALLMLAFAGVGSYYAWTGPDSPLAERVPLTVVATTTTPPPPVEVPVTPSEAPVTATIAPEASVVAVEVETDAPPLVEVIVESSLPPAVDEVVPIAETPRVVVVREQDTLYSIALAELGSGARWQEIADANPRIDPARLRVGDRLVIPSSPVGTRRERTSAEVHVVAAGETLTSIARALWNDGSKWRRLLEANEGLLQGDPDRLRVGDHLIVPAVR